MSKAVVFDHYGPADVLHFIEIPLAVPQPGQVRIRVRSAGVQPFDALFRSGAAHRWVPAAFPQRLGNEWAGTIDELAPDVTGLSIGEGVFGWAMLASYAEHVVVNATDFVAKPQQMTWSEAGALSASGQTALAAIHGLDVKAGQTLLIHAAAGGVGSFASQIARARGARVIGTASERNHDYLRSLGVSPVTYGHDLTGQIRLVAPDGVDAALVLVDSMEAIQVSLEVVGEQNRIGTVAFSSAAREHGIRQLGTVRSIERLTELVELYQSGDLQIFLQQEIPIANAAEAHRLIEGGHTRGKIVLTVNHD
jgi:enoyl reductase